LENKPPAPETSEAKNLMIRWYVDWGKSMVNLFVGPE